MRRKLFCIWMCIVMIVTLMPSMAFAEESAANIGERTNMELLDAILQERPWVLETLLDGDISNNPYAMIQNMEQSRETLLMPFVLKKSTENAGFATLLVALELYANKEDYFSDAGDRLLEMQELIKSCYGVESNEKAMEVAEDIVANVDELRYESVFNEIIKSNYTASWGESILDEDSNLENLRQRSKVLKKIKAYQTALKDCIGFMGDNMSSITVDKSLVDYGEYAVTLEEYASHVLSAYEQDLQGYLEGTFGILTEEESSLQKKIQAMAFLGGITACEALSAEGSYPSEVEHIFKNYMVEDTLTVLDGAEKLLKLGSYQLDYAIMLESLTNQTKNLAETFDYIASQTNDVDLQTVLTRYAKLARESGNSKIINYEGITSYLRSQNTITNLVVKKLSSTLIDTLDKYYMKILESGQVVYAASLGEYIAAIGAAIELGVWVGNKVTGLEDTAKKVYLCVYINNAIKETARICKSDLEQYNAAPSEEVAARIINELELLKKIRLYGEQSAYESAKYQLDAWLGKLLSQEAKSEEWQKYYQNAIDILMGCSISPVNGKPLNLQKGQQLLIQAQTFDDEALVYGSVIDNNIVKYKIAEIDKRLLGGICLNDAELIFSRNSAPSETHIIFDNLYIPFLTASGTSQINVYGGAANFGEVTNNGKLSFNIGTEDASFFVSNKLTNKSDLEILSSNERTDGILCYDFENQGTVTASNAGIQIKGDINNDGVIQGRVQLCGDGQRAYADTYFTFAPKQIISGKGTFSDLYIDSTAELGVDVIGEQTITEVFSNPSTTIHNAKRLTVTGNCAIDGGYCYSDLSFRDYAASQTIVLEGTGHLYGDVAFGGTTIFFDGLNVTTGCNLLKLSGFTRVAGDMLYAGGTIEGERFLHLCGDVNITTQTPSLKYLCLEGSTPQTIQSTKTLQLEELRNCNTSKKGLLINSPISISDLIYTQSGARYRQGKSMTLTAKARAEGDVIQGSISAENWTCSNPVNVSGTIFVNGTNQMEESGSLHTNDFVQKGGSLELAEGAQIIAVNDAAIDGSFLGGSLEVKGDVSAGALINVNQLILNGKTPQTFNNTAATIAKSLLIDNNAKGGVTINSIINVTDQFKNNCKKLIKGKNIQVGALSDLEMEELAKGDMTVTGSWNISVGKTYTIPGTLYLNKDALVTLQEGATLNIHENINSNSADIIVKQGAALNVKEYTEWTGGSIILEEGAVLNLGSDAKLSGVTIEGKGLLIICGDLHNTNCTWKFPNLKIAGKVPQSISGADIRTENLTLENTSKSGITLQTKLQYQGEKRSNEGKISGSDQISALS